MTFMLFLAALDFLESTELHIFLFDRYEEFLADNPGSLLLRILGAHCLRSYSSVFYFFVMENLFNITDEDESEEDVDSVEDSSKSSSPKSAVAQTVVNGETDVPTQVEEANVKFAIDSRGASEHDDESDDDNSERNSDTKVAVLIPLCQEVGSANVLCALSACGCRTIDPESVSRY
jgi:hypothetical protein